MHTHTNIYDSNTQQCVNGHVPKLVSIGIESQSWRLTISLLVDCDIVQYDSNLVRRKDADLENVEHLVLM